MTDGVVSESAVAEGVGSDGVVGLWLDGRVVAEYVVEPDLDVRHGPRPYLHPVRTLTGVPVTDALPEDHVWHLGASLAVQDVARSNLWGGRTYVRDAGYTWLEDHGRIVHTGWTSRKDDHLVHTLRWCDRDGGLLLSEVRELSARTVPADAWVLDLSYALTAPADREIALGSPATNGRPGGAGYGGFFWRAAPSATVPSATVPSATVPSATVPSATVPSATVPEVFTATLTGEEEVNGSAEPWVALVGSAYTLVFCGLGDGDRWFVRTRMYPGVCAAFAFEEPRVIAAGGCMRGRHAVLIADGRLERPAVQALLEPAGLPI